jgi:hypothetical protein
MQKYHFTRVYRLQSLLAPHLFGAWHNTLFFGKHSINADIHIHASALIDDGKRDVLSVSAFAKCMAHLHTTVMVYLVCGVILCFMR